MTESEAAVARETCIVHQCKVRHTQRIVVQLPVFLSILRIASLSLESGYMRIGYKSIRRSVRCLSNLEKFQGWFQRIPTTQGGPPMGGVLGQVFGLFGAL